MRSMRILPSNRKRKLGDVASDELTCIVTSTTLEVDENVSISSRDPVEQIKVSFGLVAEFISRTVAYTRHCGKPMCWLSSKAGALALK